MYSSPVFVLRCLRSLRQGSWTTWKRLRVAMGQISTNCPEIPTQLPWSGISGQFPQNTPLEIVIVLLCPCWLGRQWIGDWWVNDGCHVGQPTPTHLVALICLLWKLPYACTGTQIMNFVKFSWKVRLMLGRINRGQSNFHARRYQMKTSESPPLTFYVLSGYKSNIKRPSYLAPKCRKAISGCIDLYSRLQITHIKY